MRQEVHDRILSALSSLPVSRWGVADITDLHPLGRDYPRAISLLLAYKWRPGLYDENSFHEILVAASNRLETALGDLCRMLIAEGLRHCVVGRVQDEATLTGDFPLKMAATRAGLGWIGKGSFLVTGEYGPRVRLGAVLVGLDLPPAVPETAGQCGPCQACVEACPLRCITGVEWSAGMDRAALIDIQACRARLRGTIPTLGRSSSCGLCLLACPRGSRSAVLDLLNANGGSETADIRLFHTTFRRTCKAMKFTAVIFDLFGTLVESFRVDEYRRSLAEMAAALGAPVEEFARLWSRETAHGRMVGKLQTVEANLTQILAALGLPVEANRLAQAVASGEEYYRATFKPRQEAVPTLARLKEAGCKLGLISDCSMEAPLLWPEIALASYINVTIFSSVEGCRKPDPRLYAAACARLGVRPEECLYVGDGDNGELAGATRAGMTAVLFRAPGEEETAFRLDAEQWEGPRIGALREVPGILDLP